MIPKISIICPTYERHERHANLFKAFNDQTYTNCELIVMDDSVMRSAFFENLDDKRVKYWYLHDRMSIGDKRNHLIDIASGDIIVHFDDDDYYAPAYLSEMLQALGENDFVKQSKWLAWRELDGTLWEWDTREIADGHFYVSGVGDYGYEEGNWGDQLFKEKFLDETLWGFGFSYVYKKSVWEGHPFEDRNHGEDYRFVLEARNAGFKLIHTPHLSHLTLHVLHGGSTSRILPGLKLDALSVMDICGEGVEGWARKGRMD